MRDATARAERRTRGTAGTLALLLAAGLATACSSRPGAPPRPTSVVPSRGAAEVAVAVVIRGDFHAQVDADFSGGGDDLVDARFQAFLGTTPLEDVALRQDGTLVATVPADLAAGAHDLTVVDPAGRAGTLAEAYRVVSATDPVSPPVRFLVEPIADQVASSPFAVVITAVDDTGAVATDYQGEVQLSDLSGATVPPTLGAFVDGQWAGTLEVRATHAADVLTVAAAGGATGTSTAFAVAPAPATGVRFDGALPAPVAGACTGPVALSLRDAFGFPTTAGAPTTLSVEASPAAGFTAHADAGCAGPGAAPSVAAGRGTATFWFVATAAGPLRIAASGPALGGDVLTTAVTAGPPATLGFVSAPRTAAAGACSPPVIVEVRDAWGNPSAAGVGALALAVEPAAGASVSSDGCRTAARSVTVPAGATTATLWFTGSAAGALRLTASAPSLAAASQDELVVPAEAATLAFATPPRTVAAGVCSPAVVIEARDAFGNVAAVSRDLRVTLSASPAAGLAVYADARCTAAAGVATIAAGASSATVYLRGTAAGDYALAAGAPSLAGASQPARIAPGAPAALRFASAPQSVVVHACSGAATVALHDAFGNPSPAAAAVPVALAAAPAGTTFHADAGCAAAATSVDVAAGAATATFYFRAPAVGAVTVTASAGGLVPATQAEAVAPAAATQLVFTTAPQAVRAGACSGVVTVESRDAYGNPAPASATAATAVALSAPGLTLHATGTCSGAELAAVSLAAGETSASFHFRGTVAGSAAIAASAGGLTPATQAETVLPAAASQLAVTSAPETITAGRCSGAVTVQARDAWGNAAAVSAAVPTAVSLSSAALTFHADPACVTGPVTSVTLDAAATDVTFYFTGTAAGPAGLGAAVAGLIAASQIETIVAAAATQLAFATPPRAVQAGSCSGAVTLEARDAWGNPGPVSQTAATTVGLDGGSLSLRAGAACAAPAVASVTLAAGASTVTFSFVGTVASTSAPVAATAAGLAGATQVERVVAAAAARLAFATAAQSVPAGSCSGPTTLEVRDAYDNPTLLSSTAAASVTLTAAGLALHAGAGCAGGATGSVTLPAGATTTTFSFRGTTAAAVGITASTAGLASTTQTETIVVGALDHWAWATIPGPQLEGVAFAVTVTAEDAYGNRTTDAGTLLLSASPGAVACASACTSALETGPVVSGRWTGTVVVPAHASPVTLTAVGAGRAGTSNGFEVAGPSSRSPPLAAFTASARVIPVNGTVRFDASGSADHQDGIAALSVSWQPAATEADQSAPGAPPWGSWATFLTTVHRYPSAGTFRPRLAVRDSAGDVGYASGLVIVVPDPSSICTVDATTLADDGATSCTAKGSDGRLSLAEAVRIANAAATPVAITFAAPLTVTGASGTLPPLTSAMSVVAEPGGVVLRDVALRISGTGVLVSGLEVTGLSSITVASSGLALLEDLDVHDSDGVEVQGRARLLRVRMSGCGAAGCLRETGAGAYTATFFSELVGSGSGVGIALDACAPVTPTNGGSSPYDAFSNGWAESGAAFVGATVVRGFGTGVRIGAGCAQPWLTNLTFHENGVGVATSGTSGYVLDSIFTRQSVSAMTPTACTLSLNTRNVAFQNRSDGCIGAGASLFLADPLYVYSAAGDFRIQYASPARDAANGGNNVEVDDAGPGLWIGAGPDRGGRETY